MRVELNELVGKIVTEIKSEHNEVIFTCSDNSMYKLCHYQDCCESVCIDDINGDLVDLIGSPITLAEEVSNEPFQKEFNESFTEKNEYGSVTNKNGDYQPESHMWTFYKFATVKGYVDIRWYGESNGYYSESVEFVKADENGEFDRY